MSFSHSSGSTRAPANGLDTDVLYCAEQIRIPQELAPILKEFTKEILRVQPVDPVKYAANYFSIRASLAPPYPEIVMGKSAESRAQQLELNEQKVRKLRHASNLTAAQIEKLFSIFKARSTAEGKLNREGFKLALLDVFPERQPQDQQIGKLHLVFDVFDADRSGQIDFEEFAFGVSSLTCADDRERMKIMFSQMDLNKDGVISKEEFLSFMRRMVASDVAVLGVPHILDDLWHSCVEYILSAFQAVDKDASGSISFWELSDSVQQQWFDNIPVYEAFQSLKAAGKSEVLENAERSAQLEEAAFRDVSSIVDGVIEVVDALQDDESGCGIQ
eukprot:ANDGO_01785.mRNA.1 Protein phosphatase 2B regulatory subunit cnb-1